MNNPWKFATLGLALTGVTALSTGVTTAYLMRPATTVEAPMTAPGALAYAPQPTPARAVTQPAVMRSQTVTTRPAATTVTQPAVVRPVAVQTAATDCATGGERAMKIAKPGIIGALGGAGLGAIGGALAGGGSGAGKGALIGGLAGTAVGAGYGAYKTKQECGTIFGSTAGFADNAVHAAAPTVAPQTALQPGAGTGITVYNAR